MKKKDTIRMSLEVSPETYAIIQQLEEATHKTKSDILRGGIVLMKVAVDARKSGKKFGIAEQDQQLSTEFVGI